MRITHPDKVLRNLRGRLAGPDPWAGLTEAASTLEPAHLRLAALHP